MNATELRQKMFKKLPELETEGLTKVPNKKFWNYYRANKESLIEANILVTKSADNIWYVIDNEPNKQALLRESIKKHPPECVNCGEYRELAQRAAINGAIQYYWYCIDCDKMSGAIPHELAEHLIENEGQTVYDHAELKKRILLDKLRDKHPSECSERCGKHRELVLKAAKDDTIQYFWQCIDCDKMSGAIPHELAEHLIKNEGQVVRDIE